MKGCVSENVIFHNGENCVTGSVTPEQRLKGVLVKYGTLSMNVPLLNSQYFFQEPYLKEHVVGILFSRSKLTHLQRQVCLHIVQAIKKESSRMRDDWEVSLCSGAPAPVVTDDLVSCKTHCDLTLRS